MFYVQGEDFDGNYYEFEPASQILTEIKAECQELLESLGGGCFDIMNVTSSEDEYIDSVEW